MTLRMAPVFPASEGQYSPENESQFRRDLERHMGVGAPIHIASATLASGSTNDYAARESVEMLRITPDAAGSTLTGLANGVDGREVVVVNLGSAELSLAHESASSTAENRFLSPSEQTVVLGVGSGVRLIYDATSARWRILGNGNPTVREIHFRTATQEWIIQIDTATGQLWIVNETAGTTPFKLLPSGQIGLGGTPSEDVGLLLDTPARAITSNTDYDRLYVKASGNVTVTSGTTSPLIATARFDEPSIQLAGTGAVTDAATVFIAGAPTEGANNYALLVLSGVTFLGGALTVGGVATFGDRVTMQGALDHDGATAGFLGKTPVAQGTAIVDADGTLADITTKFNELKNKLADFGFFA